MHSEMERCKEGENVAERFKASTKKINQNLGDATVSVQPRCRAYQVEKPVSNTRRQAGLSEEGKQDKDNYCHDKCYKWRWGTLGLDANTLSRVVKAPCMQ